MRFSLPARGLSLALLLATAAAPVAQAQAPFGSPATVNAQNSSDTPVIVFQADGGSEKYLKSIASAHTETFDVAVGDRLIFRDPEAESGSAPVVDLRVRKPSHTVEVGPTQGLVVHDKNDLPALDIRFVSQFDWVYDDHDTGADMDCSIWRVSDSAMPKGYHAFGHVMLSTKGGGADPSGKIAVPVVKDISPNRDAVKTGVVAGIWNDGGSGGTHDVSIYYLDSPAGYKALGGLAISSIYGTNDAPNLAVLRADLTDIGQIGTKLWSEVGANANAYFKAYGVNATQIKDGQMRMASGGFVPLAPYGDWMSKQSPSAPADGFYNESTKPDPEFAVVMKFRLPFSEDILASDLTTLPEPSDGWPTESARTQWKLANSVAVPFTQVQDTKHGLTHQIAHPIYRAEKYVCWQAHMPMLGGNSGVEEHTFTNTVGVERGSEKSFSLTTGIKVKSETETGIAEAGFKETMTYEFSLELGMKTSDWSTLKTTTSHSEKFSIEPGTNVVFWKPIYKYVMRRDDGSIVYNPAFGKAEMAKRMVYTDAESQKAFASYGDLTNAK